MPYKKANITESQWDKIKAFIGEHGSVSSFVQDAVDEKLEEVGA